MKENPNNGKIEHKIAYWEVHDGLILQGRYLRAVTSAQGRPPRYNEVMRQLRNWPLSAVATLLVVLLPGGGIPAQAAVPTYGYEIVHTYPHDPHAFTEGLFYLNGFLYESTGLERESSIRKEKLETGEVVQKIDVPPEYFGEGIVNWKRRLVSLTWKTQVGFVYDLATLKVERKFSYRGEGWGADAGWQAAHHERRHPGPALPGP